MHPQKGVRHPFDVRRVKEIIRRISKGCRTPFKLNRHQTDQLSVLEQQIQKEMSLRWTTEHRINLFCAAMIYPFWFYLFAWIDFPDTQDSLLGRGWVGLLCAFLLILSWSSSWVRRYLTELTSGVNVILTGHYFYLVYLNHMHPAYAIGAFVTVTAVAAFFNNQTMLLVYSFFVLAFSWLASSSSDFKFQLFFLFGLATILLITFISTYRRHSHIKNEIRAKKALQDQQASMISTSKLSALGEMAGGIAHEINTPLAIIKMSSEIISTLLTEKPIDEKKLGEMSQNISSTVSRIASIISSLRMFSRDGTQDPLRPEKISYILDNTLALCQEKLKENGTELFIEPFDPQLTVQCRAVDVSQILLNLISNARDAVETADKKQIRLTITPTPDHQVEISVTDSGPGIPQDVKEKIFAPFFTTKEIGKGTGLGLSVSKGLAEAQNGSLRLDPSSLQTRFILQIPTAH